MMKVRMLQCFNGDTLHLIISSPYAGSWQYVADLCPNVGQEVTKPDDKAEGDAKPEEHGIGSSEKKEAEPST